MREVVLLERAKEGIYLWVKGACVQEWKGRNTFFLGKPLEIATVVCKSLNAADLPVKLEVINHISGEEWDGHPITGLWGKL